MNVRALLWVLVLLVAGAFAWVILPQFTDSLGHERTSTPTSGTTDSPLPTGKTAVTTPAAKSNAEPAKRDLGSRLALLEDTVAELRNALNARDEDARRIAELENTVRDLKNAMNGVSIENASAERQALFAGEEGYLKADEYFEAGKFAIAGEGYLTFVQNHPDHPDTREVMKKARDAFLRAGYKDKGFWVQDEMMKSFPDNTAADFDEMARLEKDAGLYDRAVEHMAQAAELTPNAEERLWKRLYWAWYVQLRDGSPAGIAALQQVQQEIAGSGVTNPKLTDKVAQHMRDWQLQANGN